MNAASSGRLRDTLTALALFLATVAFTLWQNTRVAALWDLSYLLDSSFRIRLGQVPYRDFPFAHAPLTFLLHAAIIRIFGRVYLPHILCAAFEAGLATLLTWRILLNLLKPFADKAPGLATLLTLPLIFLGIYGVYPHPIYDSDTILTVLLALYLLQRAGEARARNFLAGAACILPLFAKQNIGLPFLAIILFAVAVIAASRRMQHVAIAPQLWLLAGAAITLAAALVTIHATAGLHNYFYWTVTFATQRRLPSLGLILDTYHQAALLWTLPAAVAGIVLLHRQGQGAPSMAPPHRDMDGMRYRWIAFFLLAAPFLYTIAALALSSDPDNRADQLLSLWPHLLILATALVLWNLRPSHLKAHLTIDPLLPLILLATIHGTFLSQQLWGSTYAIWPLLTLLIAAMLAQVPALARPLAVVIAVTFLLCGGLYAASLERLNYIHIEGLETRATLPELHGLTTPGPWIPGFEELVHFTSAEIPAGDGILLLPGENPFYFATGRTPQFPVLLFDLATDPYTPQQTLDQARAHNIHWLIVNRNLQLTAPPTPDFHEILAALQQDYVPYRTLTNYDIYRRK